MGGQNSACAETGRDAVHLSGIPNRLYPKLMEQNIFGGLFCAETPPSRRCPGNGCGSPGICVRRLKRLNWGPATFLDIQTTL